MDEDNQKRQEAVADTVTAIGQSFVSIGVSLAKLGGLLRPAEGAQQGVPLETLSLPSRAVTALMKQGVTSVEQLTAMSYSDIRLVGGIGSDTLEAVIAALKSAGLYEARHFPSDR